MLRALNKLIGNKEQIPYGDTRGNNKKVKPPQKRWFTPVLHRKKDTRGGVLYAPFACVLFGAPERT